MSCWVDPGERSLVADTRVKPQAHLEHGMEDLARYHHR